MLALLTAVVFAQTSVNIGVGSKPKMTDSAARAERERKQDSSRLRYEIWRDSMIAARANHDSADRARRRAKQIPLTPGLVRTAFKDSRAADLLSAARRARLAQDSSITGYDATAYERMSVGLGFKRIGRERLLIRAERASRIVWSRGGPAFAEIVGKRAVMPMLDGLGDGDVDIDDAIPIPYYPGRETLWVGSGLAKADIDEERSSIRSPAGRKHTTRMPLVIQSLFNFPVEEESTCASWSFGRVRRNGMSRLDRCGSTSPTRGSCAGCFAWPSRWISGQSRMRKRRTRTTSRRDG
jgi:hypothetical protein